MNNWPIITNHPYFFRPIIMELAGFETVSTGDFGQDYDVLWSEGGELELLPRGFWITITTTLSAAHRGPVTLKETR